ncbi:MAG: oligosaccharide flippase family protein [Acidimicrobiales bacterium]
MATTEPTTQEDPGVARRVAVSTAAQGPTRVLQVVLNAWMTFVILDTFGEARFGDYVLVLTVVTLVGLAVDSGLGQIAVREVSRGEDEDGTLGTVVGMKLVYAAVGVIAVQLVLTAFHPTTELRLAGLCGVGIYIADAFLVVTATFQSRLQQQYDALVRIVNVVAKTVTVVVLVTLGATLVPVMAAQMMIPIIGGILALVLVRRRFGVHLAFQRSRVGWLFGQSWYMGLSAFVALAWLRMDLIMIELLRDDRTELGVYGAAQQPLEYLVIAGSIITTLSLPLMSRYYGKDPDRYLTTHRRTLEVGLGLYGLIVVMAFAVGEDVLAIPSDGEFVAAYDPLRLLSLSMLAMGTAVWHAAVLLSARLQRITIFVNFGSIGLGIMLNLLLIPRYGITGAAAATLMTATSAAIASGIVAYRLTGVYPDWFRLLRIAAVVLVTGAVLYGLKESGVAWLALAVLGPVVYGALLVVTRSVDLGHLKSSLENDDSDADAVDRDVDATDEVVAT